MFIFTSKMGNSGWGLFPVSLEAYSNELAPAPSWMGGFGAVQLLLELPLSSPSCSVPQCPLVDNGGAPGGG